MEEPPQDNTVREAEGSRFVMYAHGGRDRGLRGDPQGGPFGEGESKGGRRARQRLMVSRSDLGSLRRE